MITSNKAVHVTVTCDFCGTKNELTITDIHATQPITCSTCGGLLGTVAELMDEEAREDIASSASVPGHSPGRPDTVRRQAVAARST